MLWCFRRKHGPSNGAILLPAALLCFSRRHAPPPGAMLPACDNHAFRGSSLLSAAVESFQQRYGASSFGLPTALWPPSAL